MTNSYTFTRTHRLRSKLDFARVFDARVREYRGPVTLYALPNDLPHPRLGISMSRKVGTAALLGYMYYEPRRRNLLRRHVLMDFGQQRPSACGLLSLHRQRRGGLPAQETTTRSFPLFDGPSAPPPPSSS